MEQYSMSVKREDLIKKIRGLMAKTVDRGCTEQEALSALDMVRALMDAYEVDEDELRLSKEETAILRKEPPDSIDPNNVKFYLMGAVAEFCSCQAWQTRTREGRAVTFCGLPSDAHMATWMLDSLAAFVLGELARHLMDTLPLRGERRRVINGFVEGICGRISERLDALRSQSAAAATSNGRELMVVKSAAVTDKMKACGIRVRCSYSSRQSDGASIQAGRSAGDRASFGRPVSGANAALRIGAK
jgi:Protein of unknown function (DUF2786)